mmetsp:Transcript_18885/g.25982  ORF Transcript_18885/g.25982 Transcript_18885/m.25982 type:complete len:625 (-) Transcript_18885:124-1998(-)
MISRHCTPIISRLIAASTTKRTAAKHNNYSRHRIVLSSLRGLSSSSTFNSDDCDGYSDEEFDEISTPTTLSPSILSRLETLEARVHDMERVQRPSFIAGQYNILASYLGNNTEPWFLYDGLTDSEEDKERARAIAKKHTERDENGNFLNIGWPNYVQGILTQEEIERVERVHSEVFAWDVRAPKIIENIRQLDADVLSLVELDQYDEFFEPELRKMGMESIWIKRPRESSHDGCAICWRTTKFSLEAHESFYYEDDIEGSKKDRVAVMALLKMRFAPGSPRVIFVSTHLARNPESREQESIRLRQVAQLILKLKSFADRNNCGHNVPAVVAGDLNAESLDEIRSITSALFGLQKNTDSAHPLLWGCMDVPTKRTSFTLMRQSRIDYLMFSEPYLRLTDIKKGDCNQEAIPSLEHPSDHLPIAAHFQYPTELQVARDCARRFCDCIGHGALRRPLLPDELRAAFDYFDRNGNEKITPCEIREGLHTLAIAKSNATKNRLLTALFGEEYNKNTNLNEVDCDENNPVLYVTFETFQQAFHDSITNENGHNANDPYLADLVNAFEYFDLDGNGSLSHEELYTVLRAISPTAVDDEAIAEIIKAVDVDGDGNVQLDEFVAALVSGGERA